MHYPGHDNWQGMSYGLLDETPTLTRTPTNPTVGDYLNQFQDLNRTWRESLKLPEFTPNSGRLNVEEEVIEEPAADPILGPVVRKPLVEATPNSDDHMPDPVDRGPENNWGYLGPLGRAGMFALPGGGILGTLNDHEALNMGRTGWSTQFSPSLFDVATFGLFAGPGYDQAILNAENRNIAGRPGLIGKSPFMDYTHSYGGYNDVDPYDPWDGVNYADPGSVAAAQAVEDIAAAQANAVALSYGNPMDDVYYDAFGDEAGIGGDHDESAPGEMADDY